MRSAVSPGRFSIVCRDAQTHKVRRVNPPILGSREETALYSIGENAEKRRQSLAHRSLSRVLPSSTEAEELNSVYLQYAQDNDLFGYEHVWMGETNLEKTMLMFPQERKSVFT